MDIHELIRRLTFSTYEVHGRTVHKGCVPHADIIPRYLPEGFVERPLWADGWFRRVWTSDTDLAVVTYCEGDLLITKHETFDEYRHEVLQARDYYEGTA